MPRLGILYITCFTFHDCENETYLHRRVSSLYYWFILRSRISFLQSFERSYKQLFSQYPTYIQLLQVL